MNLFKNRKLLLSIRERPLPVLWLLTFLVPYLSLSLAAIPHFHNGEIGNVRGNHISVSHTSVSHHAATELHSDPSSQHPSECFLCDWSSSAHAHAGLALHQVASLSSPFEYSALIVVPSVARALSLSARAPPLS